MDPPRRSWWRVTAPCWWSLVVSLAKWMRFIGFVYFFVAGLCVLGSVALLTRGGAGIVLGAIPALSAFFVITAAVWLREAGDQFTRGVTDDDVSIVGAGFGNLRKYLILFGTFEILFLAYNLKGLVSP